VAVQLLFDRVPNGKLNTTLRPVDEPQLESEIVLMGAHNSVNVADKLPPSDCLPHPMLH
jgi:hypothetical protein